MEWLIYIGVVSLFLGALYLFPADVIKKIDEWGKNVILTVDQTLGHRLWFGFFFIVAGVAMITIGFTVK